MRASPGRLLQAPCSRRRHRRSAVAHRPRRAADRHPASRPPAPARPPGGTAASGPEPHRRRRQRRGGGRRPAARPERCPTRASGRRSGRDRERGGRHRAGHGQRPDPPAPLAPARPDRLTGIALALASSVAWGVSDFLGGLQSRRLPVLSVVAVTYPRRPGADRCRWRWRREGRCPPVTRRSRPRPALRARWRSASSTSRWRSARSASSRRSLRPESSCRSPSGSCAARRRAACSSPGIVVAIGGIALALREVEAPHTVAVPRRSVLLAALAGARFRRLLRRHRFGGLRGCALGLYRRPGGRHRRHRRGRARGAGRGSSSRRRRCRRWSRSARSTSPPTASSRSPARRACCRSSSVAGSLYPVTTVLLARAVLGERLARVQQPASRWRSAASR